MTAGAGYFTDHFPTRRPSIHRDAAQLISKFVASLIARLRRQRKQARSKPLIARGFAFAHSLNLINNYFAFADLNADRLNNLRSSAYVRRRPERMRSTSPSAVSFGPTR